MMLGEGVIQFDIADGAFGLLDGLGDAGVSGAALAIGPLHRLAEAYLGLEIIALSGEKTAEDEVGAAAVAAVDGGDVGCRQCHVRIERGNGGVVPLSDRSEKDIRRRPAR